MKPAYRAPETNLATRDVYAALLNYARDNELLIYTITSMYFAISLPLAGVALGAGDFGLIIQAFAAVSGLVLSLVWFIAVERCRRWFTFMIEEAAELEVKSGFHRGRSTLYGRLPDNDLFIKVTPRSSRLFAGIYISGMIIFAVILIALFNNWLPSGLDNG
ncbi:MAG: hypothetical protein AAFR74_01430 [Pseudomonadota bacterium]